MDIDIFPSVLCILILLVLSAYFSATETAFTSVNNIRIKNLANDGNKKAMAVQKLLENYDELLSTILVGNNIVNICMTAVSTVLFVKLYGEYGATISTVVITLVVLVFGEVSPKSLAKENAERFVMATCKIIRFFIIVLTPINFIFGAWKKLLAKIFKFNRSAAFTEDELITIVEVAENEGSIDENQSELIQNAIEFNDLEAWDVLTPRVEMVAIESDEDEEEIAKLFLETGYSRLPVYEDDLDDIIGVLNQKDFHNFVYHKEGKIEDYLSAVVFAPGSMSASLLLKKLQAQKTHMAVIVDEYGGTDGIVTIEDIVEELVGEIYDEHDMEANQDIVKTQDGSYRINCSANIEKVMDYFGLDVEMDVNTVNGWVVMSLDKLPKVGDSFENTIENTKFTCHVTKADDRRAKEIKVKITHLDPENYVQDEE